MKKKTEESGGAASEEAEDEEEEEVIYARGDDIYGPSFARRLRSQRARPRILRKLSSTKCSLKRLSFSGEVIESIRHLTTKITLIFCNKKYVKNIFKNTLTKTVYVQRKWLTYHL
jgi:hypothetical protein